jgi:hypothetical protein
MKRERREEEGGGGVELGVELTTRFIRFFSF